LHLNSAGREKFGIQLLKELGANQTLGKTPIITGTRATPLLVKTHNQNKKPKRYVIYHPSAKTTTQSQRKFCVKPSEHSKPCQHS
jgi:hypothetical protein